MSAVIIYIKMQVMYVEYNKHEGVYFVFNSFLIIHLLYFLKVLINDKFFFKIQSFITENLTSTPQNSMHIANSQKQKNADNDHMISPLTIAMAQ